YSDPSAPIRQSPENVPAAPLVAAAHHKNQRCRKTPSPRATPSAARNSHATARRSQRHGARMPSLHTRMNPSRRSATPPLLDLVSPFLSIIGFVSAARKPQGLPAWCAGAHLAILPVH